jgi:hypothetical protein
MNDGRIIRKNQARVAIFGKRETIPKSIRDSFQFIFIENRNEFDWTVDNENVKKFVSLESRFLEHYSNLLDKYRKIIPTISRVYDDLPRLEPFFRELAVQSISLANHLKNQNVGLIYHSASVSHWVDSFVLEFACDVLDIPQVFPYATIFEGRLLPLLQKSGISSRSPLNLELSKHSFEVIDQHNSNLREYGRLHTPKYFSTNQIIVSYSLALLLSFRSALRKMKTLISFSSNSSKEIESIKKFSLTTNIRLLKIHHKSIKRLKIYIKQDRQVQIMSKSMCPIVFYGHQQPEATTFTEGGNFKDHLDAILHMRESGYTEKVYFKEHFAMFTFGGKYSNQGGISRSTFYYEQLRNLNVIFLNPFEKITFNHIAATVTGSIAIENALDGKRTIVFGEPWYKGLPGCVTFEEYVLEEKIRFESKSDKIQSLARKFLRETLNGKTMGNYCGLAGYPIATIDSACELEMKIFFNYLNELAQVN